MKLVIGRVLSWLFTFGGWVVAVVRTTLDLVGYSTAPQDVEVAKTLIQQAFDLLLTLPWWGPWGFVLISTLWLMWLSWPRHALSENKEHPLPNSSGGPFTELAMGRDAIAHPNSPPQQELQPLNQFFSPTVTLVDPPPFKAEYVYVGQVFVEIDRAATDLVIIFLFRCFNGSGNGINIKNPTGRIRFGQSKDGTGIELGEMPAAPTYVDGLKIENIKPGVEFELRLEQRVTKDIAERLGDFPAGTSFSFGFEGLNIQLLSVRWQTSGRLKLWDAASIFHNPNHFHVSKIVGLVGGTGAKAD